MDEQSERSPHDARRRDGILARAIADITREMIEDALAWARGSQKKACAALGCNKVYLWQQLKKYGINVDAVKARALEGTWLYKTAPEGAPWITGEDPGEEEGDW